MKLETLNISFNSLQTVNLTAASKMKHLKTVILSSNKIKDFPKQLCQLPNVDAIDLSNNILTAIPEEIADIKAIELNLNKNRLNKLTNALSRCERLKVLRIEENCLAVEALTPVILKESQISVLAFDGNLFGMKMLQDVEGYDEVSSVALFLLEQCFKVVRHDGMLPEILRFP